METDIMRQKEAAEVAKRAHELELARLGQGNVDDRPRNREDRAKAPKLPSFVDGKDDLDAYLQRFERFADTAKWKRRMGIKAQSSVVWKSTRSVMASIGGSS